MPLLSLVKLIDRKLLRISGPDCYSYLQGLICNDLRYLYEPERIPARKHAIATPNVLSAFMLNPQGRAICDMMIYRTPLTRDRCEFSPPGKATEADELLIECDSSLASGLGNTLYGYRVRRKISVAIEDNLSLWCLFPGFNLGSEKSQNQTTLLTDNNNLPMKSEIMTASLKLVNDPRLTSMGMRIITTKDMEQNELKASIQSVIDADIKDATFKDYTFHRYLLGVGEGVRDHPESNCLPLESNADFLNSVSFTKGCYLGQELTSRIHHTGVVRKRLMPIQLDLSTTVKNSHDTPLIGGSDIIDEDSKKKVGVLRHMVRDRGLALLRYDLATKSSGLIHEGTKTKISTQIPYWWQLS